MKAIVIWEPYATAVRYDLKRIETKPFQIHHRGSLGIVAARTTLHAHKIHDPKLEPYFRRVGVTNLCDLSFGHLVAVARVGDVIPCEQLRGKISEQEEAFGDYSDGRFGWILHSLAPLKKPVPVRGQQGIFHLPADVLKGTEFV